MVHVNIEKIGELIERGQYYERYKIKQEIAEKIWGVKKDTFGMRLGVPVWVATDQSGKQYKPYLVDMESKSVISAMASCVFKADGRVSYFARDPNKDPLKDPYFDAKTNSQPRAIEEISLKIDDKDVTLKFGETEFEEFDNYIYAHRTYYAVLGETSKKQAQVEQRASSSQSVADAAEELAVYYVFEAGKPLRHEVDSKNLPNGVKTLTITWNLEQPVNKAILDKGETISEIPLTDKKQSVSLKDCYDCRLVQNQKVWMAETLYNPSRPESKNYLRQMEATDKIVSFVYSGWDNQQIRLESAQTSLPPLGVYDDGFVRINNSGIWNTSSYLLVRRPDSYTYRTYLEYSTQAFHDQNPTEIHNVTLRWDVAKEDPSNPCQYRRIGRDANGNWLRPSSQTNGSNIFNAITNSTSVWYYDGTDGSNAKGEKSIPLGDDSADQICIDLLDNVTGASPYYFALGVKYVEESGSGNYIYVKAKDLSSASPIPTLDIIYS